MMMTSLDVLESLAGYVLCGLVAVFGLVVAGLMITGRIDLTLLVSEKQRNQPGPRPVASMSRFQLLIFTFVIAISFFLVVISNVRLTQGNSGSMLDALPQVPSGVLLLLGISTSSYAVSKAIQHGTGTGGDDGEAAKTSDQRTTTGG